MKLTAGVEPPKQARSRRSYERILDATAELLADRPFDDVTVDEIVEQAGYTKGAFYHRFDGKDALLRHLVARLTAGALEAWEAFLDPDAWSDGPLRDFLEAFVGRLVAIYTRSTHLMRAFVRASERGSDEAIRATSVDLNRRVLDGFVEVLESRRDELPPEVRTDLRGAARFWLTSLTGLLQRTYLWPAEPLSPDPDPVEIEERACRLLMPYLVDRKAM